jgi:hypothetical protein
MENNIHHPTTLPSLVPAPRTSLVHPSVFGGKEREGEGGMERQMIKETIVRIFPLLPIKQRIEEKW